MKFCSHCGAQIMDEAVICIKCGCPADNTVKPAKKDDSLQIVIKVFLILGCIAIGWTIIPLAWCIPITVSVWNKMEKREPISTGLKVAVLLLVNLVAGICLLCTED